MTATQRFIEKAIEGGYLATSQRLRIQKFDMETGFFYETPTTARQAQAIQDLKVDYMNLSALLDPEAWKALGEVEGWLNLCLDCGRQHDFKNCGAGGVHDRPQWHKEWILMIDALAEGKTPEEYLSTIL